MIYLRKINISDFNYLKYIENSDEFNQFSLIKTKYSDSELKNFLFESLLPVSKTKQIRFVICEKSNDKRLGFVDLFNINFSNFISSFEFISEDEELGQSELIRNISKFIINKENSLNFKTTKDLYNDFTELS